MEQSLKYKGKTKTVFRLAVISSWLTIAFFFSIPLGLLFWMISFAYLVFKKSKLAWYLLILSSWIQLPIWSFISGSKDYFQGKASMEYFGMPNLEFYNLDPDLRVWNTTSGCIYMGFEPFVQIPNNFAVKFWTNLIGPQKNAYKGLYPTKEQAKLYIQSGEPVSVTKTSDAFLIQSKHQVLHIRSENYEDKEILENNSNGKSFVLNNECVLLGTISKRNEQIIFISEKQSGKIFARYLYNKP